VFYSGPGVEDFPNGPPKFHAPEYVSCNSRSDARWKFKAVFARQ